MDKHYCHKCRIETVWEKIGSSIFERCKACGMVYPCQGHCTHPDCYAEKQHRKNPEKLLFRFFGVWVVFDPIGMTVAEMSNGKSGR